MYAAMSATVHCKLLCYMKGLPRQLKAMSELDIGSNSRLIVQHSLAASPDIVKGAHGHTLSSLFTPIAAALHDMTAVHPKSTGVAGCSAN